MHTSREFHITKIEVSDVHRSFKVRIFRQCSRWACAAATVQRKLF